MAVVTLERLSKRYEGASDLAVKEVSLSVADGEFMVLLGPRAAASPRCCA